MLLDALAPPLAALQCRALAALASMGVGIRAFHPVLHPPVAEWRKPAFAGLADVAQCFGANGRRGHGRRFTNLTLDGEPAGSAARGQAMSAPVPLRRGATLADRPGAIVGLTGELVDAEGPADELPADVDDAGAEHDSVFARSSPSCLDDSQLAALIARVAEHHEDALAALYDATSPRVFGLVSRMVTDSALAEEVVEDTYWQVWRQAARFDAARGRPVTWLLAMARSRAIDALRRRERHRHAPLSDDEEAGLCDEAAAGPPDLLAATRSEHLLHAALAQLEAQPRQLIALAFFRGMTHEEVADATGLPLGTVKSQIRRSLQALKRCLETAGCPGMPL